MNRTLLDWTRAMLRTTSLPKSFWTEAVNTASYVINRSPSVVIDLKTPMEMWTGKTSDYSQMHTFRSPVYVMYNDQVRSKLDPISRKCIFLGYADGVRGYRLWDPTAHKTVIIRDVVFGEDKLQARGDDNTMNKEPKTTTIQVEKDRISSEATPEHEEQESFVSEEGEPSTFQELSSVPAALAHSTCSYLPYLPPPSVAISTPYSRKIPPPTLVKVSSSDNYPTVTATSSIEFSGNDDGRDWSASEIVRKFYGGINGRDLSSVEDLIADDCVYEDLVFPQPFRGRKAILEFFKSFMDSISKDLQFAIDDISTEDSLAVGVTWHLDWKGKPFPFSRGCSFYRLAVVKGKKQIVYGRDCVEPAIKPGEAALVVIRGVTWLLQKFPQLADKF